MNRHLCQINKHLLNSLGKRVDRKYLVIESDDWGSERIPGNNELKKMISKGIDVFKNPFNYLDSLETENDMSALYDVLLKYRDIAGNHPIITTNFVTANPDYKRIREAKFQKYYYESILSSYNKKDKSNDIFSIIKDGIEQKFILPQFHGREHLNVFQWLNALKSGNKVLLDAFDAGIYGIDLESEHTSRNNFMAAFDGDPKLYTENFEQIIGEGTKLFKDIFGFYSKSFIAPCYSWHPKLEPILKNNKVDFLQGLPIQYIPQADGGYRKRFHYQGQKNRHSQLYLIRNCFFEPSINNRINYVKDCLKRLEIIYYWNKPAIMGTHRINFTGSLNERNRTENLKMFDHLLNSILEKWPDVEFITSDRLGEIYLNNRK